MKYIIENRSELPDSEAIEIVSHIVAESAGIFSGLNIVEDEDGKRYAVSYDKNKASHRFVVFDYRSEK
tara:strand:- start:21943 stop:22146 length:204 start_codon:yes stop_codon:yes gene_type:complete